MSNTRTAQNALNLVLNRLNELDIDIAGISWARFNYDRVADLATPTVSIHAESASERRVIAEAFDLPRVINVYGEASGASQVGMWADIPVKVFSGADEIDRLGTIAHPELSAA